MKTSEIKANRGKINGESACMVKIIDTDKDLHSMLDLLGFEQSGEWYYKLIDASWVNIPTAARLYIKERIYHETEGNTWRTGLAGVMGYFSDADGQMEWVNNCKDVPTLCRAMNLML